MINTLAWMATAVDDFFGSGLAGVRREGPSRRLPSRMMESIRVVSIIRPNKQERDRQ